MKRQKKHTHKIVMSMVSIIVNTFLDPKRNINIKKFFTNPHHTLMWSKFPINHKISIYLSNPFPLFNLIVKWTTYVGKKNITQLLHNFSDYVFHYRHASNNYNSFINNYNLSIAIFYTCMWYVPFFLIIKYRCCI